MRILKVIFLIICFYPLVNFSKTPSHPSHKSSSSKSAIVSIDVDLLSEGSEIKFDKQTINVKFGQSIHLTYRNKAPLDSEITHNVAIINLGFEDRLIASLKEHDYDLSKIDQKYFVAKTKILNPGESDTITFKPKKPGVYTYICLMPGHGSMLGMKGYLTVQQ